MIRKYRRFISRPAVGGDVLGSKFDLQKALAWKKKIGSTQSHLEWPPCRVVWSVSQLLYLLQRAGHFKFFSPSFFVGLGLNLPDMIAVEAITILKHIPITSNPIVVLTADIACRWKTRALKAGAAEYILKPILLAIYFRLCVDSAVPHAASSRYVSMQTTMCI